MFLVEFVNGLFGIGEDPLVPRKRTVFCVPSRGAKSGAEVNECVAREFLLAKRSRFGKDFFVARESAVGLLVAKSPERRHLGITGEPGILGHEHGRFV